MITFITEVFVFLQAPTFFLSLLDLISFLSFFRLIVFILTQVFAINSQSSNQENILRLSTEIHLLTLNVERNETPPSYEMPWIRIIYNTECHHNIRCMLRNFGSNFWLHACLFYVLVSKLNQFVLLFQIITKYKSEYEYKIILFKYEIRVKLFN